jgi:leader peptidase (prepilin peptidase)/N-methyltransferase
MEIILFALLGIGVGVVINFSADYLLAASPTRIELPLRAPLAVLASAAAFAFLAVRYNMSAPAILMSVYTAVFLFVLVTDIEDRAIFHWVLVAATFIALVASPLSPISWTRALLGGAIAFAIVFAIYAFSGLYARLRRIHVEGGAFGRGDVYLATFMGVVVGFPAVFLAIVYAILLAGAAVVLLLVYQLIRYHRIDLHAVFPYGPFFCIAGWAFMVFGA